MTFLLNLNQQKLRSNSNLKSIENFKIEKKFKQFFGAPFTLYDFRYSERELVQLCHYYHKTKIHVCVLLGSTLHFNVDNIFNVYVKYSSFNPILLWLNKKVKPYIDFKYCCLLVDAQTKIYHIKTIWFLREISLWNHTWTFSIYFDW